MTALFLNRRHGGVSARSVLMLAALAACARAEAVDYQVHGYAAQGYVDTTKHNFFGDSENGSTDYYEAGINASVEVHPSLIFAAQAAIRDAGISDDGSLRLDYALMDYRFLAEVDRAAGFRIGKVKNAMGFYNETRDVVFTRPSILLPTVYNDNQNQRSLIFTSPGAQLYANFSHGAHELSFSGTGNFNRDVRTADERLLIDLSGLPFDMRIKDSWNAQIMDSIAGGKWQFGISYFFGRFTLTTPDPINLAGTFDVGITLFSARYNASRFTVTAEYVLNPNDNRLTLGGATLLTQDITADSGYLQAEYRLTPHWGLMARMDAAFRDRNDRSGREFAAANPGADRNSRVSRDLTVGVNWRPDEHWGVFAEYHRIHGTLSLQRLENTDGSNASPWSMVMLMAAYKF